MNTVEHPKHNIVAGYIRVSQVGGRSGASFISPEVQRESIERWAAYAGAEVVWLEPDLDQSGGSQERPALREAMRMIEAGEVGGIAVAKLDRFARNLAGAHADLATLDRCGARLVCVAENLDTGAAGANGALMLNILLSFATFERDRLSEGWATAKARAVEGGRKASRAPLGYVKAPDGRLVVDPETAPIVREVFETAARSGLHAALAVLRERDGRDLDLFWLRRMLANRTYLGEQVHGELVNPDACEALVTRAVWTAAQPGEATQRRRASAAYPLSGLAVCATCGAPMVGARSGRGKRGYRCSHSLTKAKAKGLVCAEPALVGADALEEIVRAELESVLAGLSVQVGDAEDLAALEAAMADAEEALADFASDLTLRRALGASWAATRDVHIAAVDAAREAYDAAARSSATVTVGAADLDASGDLGALARAVLASIVVLPGRGNVRARVGVQPR